MAARVLPYQVGGAVEVCGFGVGAEDVAEEKVCDSALDTLAG